MRTAFVGVAALLVLLSVPGAKAEHRMAANVASASAKADEPQPAGQTSADAGGMAKPGAVSATGGSLPTSLVTSLSLALAVAKDLAQAPLPPPITLTLTVDLRAQRVTVRERGKVKHVWPISSGRADYATQTGTFQPQWTSKMWYSRQWDMAPMPHAVFFNKGTAFHATGAVGMLGRPASHGCIRLAPGNAAQLYALVHRHGLASTKVTVHGSPKEPAIARRNGKGQAYAANGYQARPQAQRAKRPSASMWGF